MIRRLLRDKQGSVALEFVLVLPIMLVIVFGVVEATGLVRASMQLSSAATTIADLVAQQSSGVTSGTSGSLGNFCLAGKLVMTPLSASGSAGSQGAFTAAIVSVTNQPGSAGASADWESDASCAVSAPSLGSNAATLAAGMVPNDGDSVIVVKTTYIYRTLLQLVLPGPFTLTQTAFSRPRSNANISCIATCS